MVGSWTVFPAAGSRLEGFLDRIWAGYILSAPPARCVTTHGPAQPIVAPDPAVETRLEPSRLAWLAIESEATKALM